MKAFTFYKAHGHGVPDMIVSAIGPVPDVSRGPAFESESATFFREQGRELAATLRASLPGGTIDALLIELLQAKASILSVRG